ncbi:MAG: type II secretion system protein N [Sedimentisphaerales bacterium]|nr:type II secretion system protein N [Sedimentisphaerales bacterium]
MKNVLEIPRILLVTNIVLLVILGYIVAGFIFRNDSEQSAVVEPISTTDGEKNALSKDPAEVDNPDIIIKRNIFGSSGLDSAKQNPEQGTKVNSISVLNAQLRLLATVAGDEEVACAVIENVKTKIQDLYRIGDIIEGTRIERIDRNKIVLISEGRREVLNLYVTDGISGGTEKSIEPMIVQESDAEEAVSVISPTEREINKKAFLAKVGGMEAIIKTVQIAPYVEDGKEKGVRITGLEGLSMARFVGFENGDIIQNINGSTVTNRRKAFQILRKARSQSSIDIQLLRGQEEKKLSFGIK